ncbi:hypothetical protein K438DRAFT_1764076 [Mycena galopus ATCC 62051]|nr:hypothetical protein K438DRAFT_1764076 [Mycena galopus ATCC 62051]
MKRTRFSDSGLQKPFKVDSPLIVQWPGPGSCLGNTAVSNMISVGEKESEEVLDDKTTDWRNRQSGGVPQVKIELPDGDEPPKFPTILAVAVHFLFQFPTNNTHEVPSMDEEAPKSRGWGGRRANSGRKKRKLVPDDDINTDSIGGGAGGQPSTSRLSSMSETGQSVSHQRPNIVRRAATTVASSIRNTVSDFFGTRTSQQAQAVGHTNHINTTNNLVEPLSASAAIGQLCSDLTALVLDDAQETTEQIFDESLGDGDGDEDEDEDDSVSAEMAQKEATDAEVTVVESANHQWLKATLDQIINDTVVRRKLPHCYRNGQFWVRPIDPVFALDRAAITGFLPTILYLLPIFVWLPMFLPGHPDSFNFANASLGYSGDPIARRVSTLTGQDYFLLTNRFLCPSRREDGTGCGQSYQGSDPWIIRQLPEFVQRAFPGIFNLLARGAIDTSELDVMKVTFAGHFGAEPFSQMVRELKTLHHNRLETIYYCAALHFGLRGPQQIPQFSKFSDPLGYAGYAPSRQYFKSMFTAWFSVHRIFIDRVMSSHSATIIKSDHTYKTIDHQSCLPGGKPINAAMYSIVNSDEEVRAYAFTLTQSFPPLREVFERMQAELLRHGHPKTRLLYTDNPKAERKFHESVTPSLLDNVEHICARFH